MLNAILLYIDTAKGLNELVRQLDSLGLRYDVNGKEPYRVSVVGDQDSLKKLIDMRAP
jgi:hypothetical protein